MRAHSPANKSAVRFAGWCGLLLYVGALSPIGLGLGALLGTMDRDHRAILQPGAAGMRLVLRHESPCAGHQHRVVARVLTAFAQPASSTDPDHVLQFTSPTSLMRDVQPVIAPPHQTESSTTCCSSVESLVAVCPAQLVLPLRPPPDHVRQCSCQLSTVLLI